MIELRIIYLPRKKLTLWAIVLTIALVLVIWAMLWQQVTSAPAVTEPFYQGMDSEKQMALTFNVDWGQEFLPDILAALEKKKVKATFFLTGRWAKKYPDYAKQIAEAGHEVGNHGLKHRSPNSMSATENREDITQAEQAIEDVTGIKTTLFAPASGERKKHVIEAAHGLGYSTILWSIDTVDWRRDKSAAQIAKRVLDKAHNGAIVLMHPTKATAASLPQMIEQLLAQGYTLKPVSKILPSDN